MKLVALTSAAVLAATTAFAGNPAPFTPVDDTIVESTEQSLGSAAWIVPLVAIALVAGVISMNDDDD